MVKRDLMTIGLVFLLIMVLYVFLQPKLVQNPLEYYANTLMNDSSLPQGLELLPSGEISGRTTFNTFSIDLGETTFDATQGTVRNVTIQETTFDSTFVFTVNAYAEDTSQVIYKVESVTVINGGSGFILRFGRLLAEARSFTDR